MNKKTDRHVKATRRTIHGTLLYVFNRGVLILGESGTGKSRIAREILSLVTSSGQCGLVRSARLVADDVIELESTLEGFVGSAPKSLFGLLELSSAGIVDVRRVFGPSMVRRTAPVDIIISLEESPDSLSAAPQITQNHLFLMGRSIPVIHLEEGISGDAVVASIAEYIMIEAGAVSPVLDALVK